jgi:hypothetical protein
MAIQYFKLSHKPRIRSKFSAPERRVMFPGGLQGQTGHSGHKALARRGLSGSSVRRCFNPPPGLLLANELGLQRGHKFDAELLFICAAFHDFGLLKQFSSADDRFEVDSANAVRQFLEHHRVPAARIQVAWDAISLHTTPGIAAYKPVEVELLYDGVGLDVLGIGYEHFPGAVRKKVVAQYPRINFKQDIAKAFLGGFEHKTQTTEGTCNEDICSQLIRDYRRSDFYDQIQNSPFENS